MQRVEYKTTRQLLSTACTYAKLLETNPSITSVWNWKVGATIAFVFALVRFVIV